MFTKINIIRTLSGKMLLQNKNCTMSHNYNITQNFTSQHHYETGM